MAVQRSRGRGAAQRAGRTRLFCRATVRPAAPRDAPAIAAMANALAHFTVGAPGRMTAVAVRRDLLGEDGLGCLVADHGGEAVGYALWSAAYETAFAARGIYLSDLFVRPEHRRHGVGRGLMRALAEVCDQTGGRFIWWAVPPENAAARRFYDGLGATSDPVQACAIFEAPFRALLDDG